MFEKLLDRDDLQPSEIAENCRIMLNYVQRKGCLIREVNNEQVRTSNGFAKKK